MKYYTIASIFIFSLLTACGGSKKIATSGQTKQNSIVKEKIEDKEVKIIKIDKELKEIIVEKPKNKSAEVLDNQTKLNKENTTIATSNKKTLEAFDHTGYNNLIAIYVSDEGNVNYNGFKRNWGTLRNYIKDLGENMPKDNWTKEDKLSYWMNAYNAMTIDLILRNSPLESIKDIKNPWKQRFWKLGKKYYNLNEIEHKILRKMGDPRIHFGINCASFSCPPLLNEAFTADKVDKQLDNLAKRFVNDKKRNTITANSIEISKIFNWFAKDFETNGSVIDFLNKYSDVSISTNAKKKYKDYDWSLNK